MDTREAFQLLTLASAFDGRTVDKETATVWAEVLHDIPLPDAVEAMKAHYREEGRWMMPAHVTHRVQGRAALTMSPEAPESCPGGVHRRLPDGTCLFCTDREGA